jgi:hypothetical protein
VISPFWIKSLKPIASYLTNSSDILASFTRSEQLDSQ